MPEEGRHPGSILHPGVTNLITGMANALIDCCPVVAIGGSSPISQFGRQVFQEIDQVELMRGCTKHVDRIHNLKRIPQQVNFAIQTAMSGKPGPVYLDFPGDLLYQKIEESEVDWSFAGRPLLDSRPLGDPRNSAHDSKPAIRLTHVSEQLPIARFKEMQRD